MVKAAPKETASMGKGFPLLMVLPVSLPRGEAMLPLCSTSAVPHLFRAVLASARESMDIFGLVFGLNLTRGLRGLVQRKIPG